MGLRARWLWAVPALALAAGFCALGFWQQERAGQKQRWLDGYATAMAAPPRALSVALAQPPMDVPVRVEGEVAFDPGTPRLLLDNQQRGGHVGVRAYVLARSPGAAWPFLVELGWLPLPPDRALPSIAVPEATMRVRGVLLPWPGQGLRAAPNPAIQAGRDTLLTYLDPEEIAAATGGRLYHGLFQPEPAADMGYLRDAGTQPNTLPPERHRGYAVQWWGLSLTVLVVYLILAFRRRTS